MILCKRLLWRVGHLYKMVEKRDGHKIFSLVCVSKDSFVHICKN